jgi:hypothetical protein
MKVIRIERYFRQFIENLLNFTYTKNLSYFNEYQLELLDDLKPSKNTFSSILIF